MVKNAFAFLFRCCEILTWAQRAFVSVADTCTHNHTPTRRWCHHIANKMIQEPQLVGHTL